MRTDQGQKRVSQGRLNGSSGSPVVPSPVKKLTVALASFSIVASFASLASAETIESSSHSTTGYVRSDGTIEDSSHRTRGYIRRDGTIENSSHSTIGYVRKDGTVENASHSTIGYAKGVPQESAAVVFFFFKFG